MKNRISGPESQVDVFFSDCVGRLARAAAVCGMGMALVAVPQRASGQTYAAPTTTTIAASATSVAYEQPVTLTATVTAGGALVGPGQVAFCDQAMAYCNAWVNLGVVQLNSSGTAIFRVAPGTIGAHNLYAYFVGRTGFAPGRSANTPVTVTGVYPTGTTIASSGGPGAYTLTGTVVGIGTRSVGPTGTVSFLNTSSSNNPAVATATLGTSVAGTGIGNETSTTSLNYPNGRAAVGDFNGDGIADLAFANSAPYSTDTTDANTVTIALGNGDGTFTTLATHPATGTSPNGIVTADFNGDGKLDLAIVNSGSNTVTVLLGNGDGTFTAAASPAVAVGPYSIVEADFNGDGNEDLAVAAGDNAVTILLGNGDGTFATSTVSISGSLANMTVGDFNGDGRPDLAVQNIYPTSEVEILLGNGDGTFTVGTPIAAGVGSNLNQVVAGDLNGDQSSDLIITNQQSAAVTVLLSNSDGTFTQIPVASATGTDPEDVQVADFNGDGMPDLAVSYSYGGQGGIQILPGNGDGTFTKTPILTGFTVFAGIALGDFNGDGTQDIASSDGGTNLQVVLIEPAEVATATASNVVPAGTGTDNVEASYPGDTNFGTSVSATTPLTAGGGVKPQPSIVEFWQ